MTTTRAVLNQSKKDVAGLYIDAFQACLIFLMPIDKFYLVYWEKRIQLQLWVPQQYNMGTLVREKWQGTVLRKAGGYRQVV